MSTQIALEDVLERMADGFIAMDADGILQVMNAAAEQMGGLRREQVLGRSLWEMFPDLARSTLPDLCRSVTASNRPAVVEFEWPLTGSHYELRVYPAAAGTTVFFRDVTAHQRENTALVAALTHVQDTDLRNRRFLAMMSHELRMPLQAIMGYADLIMATVGHDLPPQTRDDLQAIRDATWRLGALIRQMLDISRLAAGQQELVSDAVGVGSIVADVVQESAPLAAVKHLLIVVDVPEDLPFVRGDAAAVQQILRNLVGNAIKFTAVGRVSIAAEAHNDEIAVHVTDTGMGMSPQVIDHIFEEFWQADGGLTRRYEGSGLGLSIAKQLTEAMGGRLTVESAPGVGSRLTVFLPRLGHG